MKTWDRLTEEFKDGKKIVKSIQNIKGKWTISRNHMIQRNIGNAASHIFHDCFK